MSDEAKCNCQHCNETIAFPLEMAGHLIDCPHCQKETLLLNPPAASAPVTEQEPQAENSELFKLFGWYLRKETPLHAAGEAKYILYLTPGDVRYLQVRHFIEYEADQWICFFKQMPPPPEIKGPFGGEKIGLDSIIPEQFVKEINWEDKFKIQHSFAVINRDFGVPSMVYRCFHLFLKLRSLEFGECINSWVKEAWNDYFKTDSFANSDQHLVLECYDGFSEPPVVHSAVFKITPYVVQRHEELQKLKEAEKTAENLEQLCRSNFKIFVYLMEDLRNGFFKIGQSQTPEKRENTLQSEVPEISLRFYLPAHDSAEKELHEMFDAKRVRGEWFQLTPQDILSVIGFLKQKGDVSRAFADYDWLGKITLGS